MTWTVGRCFKLGVLGLAIVTTHIWYIGPENAHLPEFIIGGVFIGFGLADLLTVV